MSLGNLQTDSPDANADLIYSGKWTVLPIKGGGLSAAQHRTCKCGGDCQDFVCQQVLQASCPLTELATGGFVSGPVTGAAILH